MQTIVILLCTGQSQSKRNTYADVTDFVSHILLFICDLKLPTAKKTVAPVCFWVFLLLFFCFSDELQGSGKPGNCVFWGDFAQCLMITILFSFFQVNTHTDHVRDIF